MAWMPGVETYLARLPADQHEALQRIRARIAHLVPDAAETISYGMPAFKPNGRFLLSYAGWKAHCASTRWTDSFLSSHTDALEDYGRTKGSLHFTPATPLPDAVLDELILARVADLDGGEAHRPIGL